MTTFASQIEYWMSDRHLHFHEKQYAREFHSTAALRRFVAEVLPDCQAPCDAIDVGCGGGANIFHLGKLLRHARWVGADINSKLFPVAQRLMQEYGGLSHPIEFVDADCFALHDTFSAQRFDIVFSIQILSWISEYERPIAELLRLLKPGGYLFVTSLFTDFLVDAKIMITEYDSGSDANGSGPLYYNIYAYERFCEQCRQHGAISFEYIDFIIDEELPFPSHRHMHTYTTRLTDGTLEQRSGPILMPWRFIAMQRSA